MATSRQRGPNNPELSVGSRTKEGRDAMKDYDKVDIESYLRSISYDLESDYLDGLQAEWEGILAPRASKPSSVADLNANHQSYEAPHRDEAVSARLFVLPERAKI